jgi:hypothetical protein
MTTLEVSYRYGQPLRGPEVRALSTLTEVYGIRRVQFDEKAQSVRVEYDASRLQEDSVSALLRQAGLDLKEKLLVA